MKKLLIIIFLLNSFNSIGQCHAQFYWGPVYNNDNIPDSIFFIDSSLYASTWYWEFGDNTTSTIQGPVHNYTSPGLYYVCLTITDSNNCTDTFCDSIWVTSCETSLYYAPTSQLNAIKFFDMPLQYPYPPVNWFWEFGDNTTSSNRLPVHTYSASGIYNVCLTVTNLPVGCIYTDCKNIIVSPPLNAKISICDGYWNDPNIWSTGQIPAYQDSIFIYNDIVLNSNITMKNPGFLYIEESSSLCGHYTLSSKIFTYGILNIDHLIICDSDSNSTSQSYSDYTPVNILNGWQVGCDGSSDGYATQLWPTSNAFNCSDPPPCNVSIIKNADNIEVLVYPNPSKQNVTIQFQNLINENLSVIVYNLNGQVIQKKLNSLLGRIIIDKNELNEGLYFYQIKDANIIIRSGKFIIE